jgi:hypothetical protein
MGNTPFLERSMSVALLPLLMLAGCGGSGVAPASAPPADAPHASPQGIVLATSAGSPTKVGISWADGGAHAAAYRIDRDGGPLGMVRDAAGTTYDTGLKPASRYCYQVTALDAAGAGIARSNESCTSTAPLAGWDIQMIYQAPPVTLALDAEGRERVSFCGSDGVYFQARQADGSLSTTRLDPGAACFNALLVVAADGSDHIVYADTNHGQLRYATDVSGSWTISVIAGADGAEFPSLAVDRADAIHVAYLVFTGHSPDCFQLDYATDASGSWQTTLVESVLAYPSIGVDDSGMPHVAYLGQAQPDGSYPVHYRSYVSDAWSDEIVAASADSKTLVALAVDAAGDASLVYKSQAELRYVAGVSGRWVSSQVDSFDAAGLEEGRYGAYDVSIDLDTSGRPHLAYQDSGGNLKYARLDSGRWATLYVDTEGTQNQIKVDAAGHAHVTYGSVDNLYSKLAVSP